MKKIKIEDKVVIRIIDEHGKAEAAVKSMTNQMWKQMRVEAEEFFTKIREEFPELGVGDFTLLMVDGEWYVIQKEGE